MERLKDGFLNVSHTHTHSLSHSHALLKGSGMCCLLICIRRYALRLCGAVFSDGVLQRVLAAARAPRAAKREHHEPHPVHDAGADRALEVAVHEPGGPVVPDAAQHGLHGERDRRDQGTVKHTHTHTERELVCVWMDGCGSESE